MFETFQLSHKSEPIISEVFSSFSYGMSEQKKFEWIFVIRVKTQLWVFIIHPKSTTLLWYQDPSTSMKIVGKNMNL